jgi:hypothetical protein
MLGMSQEDAMGRHTYSMLTDPKDPIFHKPMIVSHPDLQRDLIISTSNSQKKVQAKPVNIPSTSEGQPPNPL